MLNTILNCKRKDGDNSEGPRSPPLCAEPRQKRTRSCEAGDPHKAEGAEVEGRRADGAEFEIPAVHEGKAHIPDYFTTLFCEVAATLGARPDSHAKSREKSAARTKTA